MATNTERHAAQVIRAAILAGVEAVFAAAEAGTRGVACHAGQ